MRIMDGYLEPRMLRQYPAALKKYDKINILGKQSSNKK